jgi:PilZ domain
MKQVDCSVQRAENRVSIKVTALLVGGHGTLRVETGVTENVSSRGARVVSTCTWALDDTILVAIPGFHFTSSARIAYCDSLGVGRFGIGLEFVGSGEHLEITALATALQFSRT